MEKKSGNLPLIATEGFSTVLDSAMYPWQHLKSPKKNPITGSYQKTGFIMKLWDPFYECMGTRLI